MKLNLLLIVAIFIPRSYAVSQSTQDDSNQANESRRATSAIEPKSQKVYHVGGDVKAPRVISSSQPQLDEKQSSQLSSGKKPVKTSPIIVKIVVGEDGIVRSAKVVESHNNRDLDAKAIDAAKQWKFEPATKKGVPEAVEFAVSIDFHLYK